MPPTQLTPDGHAWPQAPQLPGSDEVATHVRAHKVSPLAQPQIAGQMYLMQPAVPSPQTATAAAAQAAWPSGVACAQTATAPTTTLAQPVASAPQPALQPSLQLSPAIALGPIALSVALPLTVGL